MVGLEGELAYIYCCCCGGGGTWIEDDEPDGAEKDVGNLRGIVG
jgi:hypothetical protein